MKLILRSCFSTTPRKISIPERIRHRSGPWAAAVAPLPAFVEQCGVFSWRLRGVIYESESVFIKAARADCLNADGTINRYPNPMEYLRLERKRRDREEDSSA